MILEAQTNRTSAVDDLDDGKPLHDTQVKSLSPFILKIPFFEPQAVTLSHEAHSDVGPHSDIEPQTDQGIRTPLRGSRSPEQVLHWDPLPEETLPPHVDTSSTVYRKQIAKRNPKSRTLQNVKTSMHGIKYSDLSTGITKRVASGIARSLKAGKSKKIINSKALSAVVEAGSKFLEQFSTDLGKFATHAGRKCIDESDAVVAMKR